MNETYNFSFRCYFPSAEGPRFSTHYQALPLCDVPRCLDAYRFTHPTCISITMKVWFSECPAAVDADCED